MKSKLGWVLAGAYIIVSAYLIATQGLTGESFIAIILGLPWSMLGAFFEYGNSDGFVLYVMLLVPMALNAFLLHWLGSAIGRRMR